MTISRHYAAAELAAARAAFPNHWIVEVDTGGAACLIAIEANKKNLETPVPFRPEITADMLDGGALTTPQRRPS